MSLFQSGNRSFVVIITSFTLSLLRSESSGINLCLVRGDVFEATLTCQVVFCHFWILWVIRFRRAQKTLKQDQGWFENSKGSERAFENIERDRARSRGDIGMVDLVINFIFTGWNGYVSGITMTCGTVALWQRHQQADEPLQSDPLCMASLEGPEKSFMECRFVNKVYLDLRWLVNLAVCICLVLAISISYWAEQTLQAGELVK